MTTTQDQLYDETNLEVTINEEYKIWKKNAPFLYDLVISHELLWPSLSVQWLPKKESTQGQGYSIHKLIIGTQTNNSETNHLMVAKVRLPKDDNTVVDEGNQAIGLATGDSRIEIETQIVHDGDIVRARYQPHRPSVLASFTQKGEIHIFDYARHPSKPVDPKEAKPDLRLIGHQPGVEGFGLSWSEQKAGHLLSAGYDGKVCLWDLETLSKEPKQTFSQNTQPLEDVNWHRFHPDIFGACGDDRHVRIWDIRKPQAIYDLQAHTGDIYCLDFNPFNEYLFLTGSEDKRISLFDMRNCDRPVHTFEGHTDQIMQVKWSPHQMKVFASSSADRRAMVWDFGKCGQQQTPEEQQDGPPELLFIHGGHRSKVCDIDWNVNEKYVLSSVEETNILQVWQIGSHVYSD